MPQKDLTELVNNFLSLPLDEREMLLRLSRERAAAARARQPKLTLVVSDLAPPGRGCLSGTAGGR